MSKNIQSRKVIEPRLYHYVEVKDMLNEAYWHGLQARTHLNLQTTRLAQLVRDILRTAAISPVSRLEAHLLELAAQEAGERDLKNLAAEVTKRYDIVTSAYSEATGTKLSDYDQTMYYDARIIREAVLQLSQGDNSMILREDVLAIAGHVIHWQAPENAGRKPGMSESKIWVCERLLHHRKKYKRGWWRSGLELHREIMQTPGNEWTQGHQLGYEVLKNYIEDDETIHNQQKLNSVLSDFVGGYRALKKKNE